MMMWLNKANFYLVAWCIYSLQGVLYPKGSIIAKVLIVFLMVVSLYHCFVVNSRYKLPKYFWGLNILLAMFTVYGLLLMCFFDSNDYAIPLPKFNYLKGILMSFLPIFSFYFFSKEKMINEFSIRCWFIVFLAVAIMNYFAFQKEMLLQAILMNSEKEEFTNGIAYAFLALLPMCVYFYKKSILQYVFWGVCMFFIMMGMKRGAIIIGFLCLLFFLWYNLKEKSIRKKIALLGLSAILCFVGFLYVQNLMNESTYFNKRIENTLDGNSSGRDYLFFRLVDYYWNETSPLQFVFGSGANATIKVAGNFAHNDWIEIAVNQGLIGLLIYIAYFGLFFRFVRQNNFKYFEKLSLQLLFIICFMKSLFSMSYASIAIPLVLVLGYNLNQENQNE